MAMNCENKAREEERRCAVVVARISRRGWERGVFGDVIVGLFLRVGSMNCSAAIDSRDFKNVVVLLSISNLATIYFVLLEDKIN